MFKTTTLLIVIVGFVASVYASFESLEVKNLNIDYISPTGQATVEVISYQDIEYTNATAFAEREPAGLKLSFDGQDVVISGLSDKLLDAAPFRLTNFSVKAQGDTALLKVTESLIENGTDFSALENLFMTCQKNRDFANPAEVFLDGCITNSTISLNSFYAETNTKLKLFIQNLSGVKGTTHISDLKIQSKNNRLSFSVHMGLKVSGQGAINYYSEPDKKQIKVRIDRVKAGFFNMTNRFFSELNGLDLPDNVKVQRPYIIVDLTSSEHE